MLKAAALVATAVFALFAASQSEAALVRVNLAGHVYHLTDTVADRFAIGDKVTGYFVYQTPTIPTFVNGPYSFYLGQVTEGLLDVNGYTVNFGSSTRLITSDDELAYDTLLIDRFMVDQFAPGKTLNGLPFYGAFLNWQDNTGTTPQGRSLPTTQAQFDSYVNGVSGAIDWVAGNGQNRVTFVLTDVAASVPEPSTWMMMILGFGAIGAYSRRRYAAVTYTPA